MKVLSGTLYAVIIQQRYLLNRAWNCPCITPCSVGALRGARQGKAFIVKPKFRLRLIFLKEVEAP